MKPIPILGALLTAAALAVVPSAASAASAAPITSVFGGAVNCTTMPAGSPVAGQRFCQGATPPYFSSPVPSFDGTPIDVSVTLPPAPASGEDGNFPVVGVFHGYGSQKILGSDATNAQRWLQQGYAVYSITDRGFWGSCGVLFGPSKPPQCDNGHIRLMSAKWEVRDAQFLLGQLADENVIDPQRIGAVGGSYGGGMAMILGALKNRVMLQDGSLVPWTSPGGKALRIGATAPEYGWSDLVASLQPNGSTLDYAARNPYTGPNGDRRFGIQKQNWNTALYAGGAATGYYAAPGTDPSADITTWKAFNDTGGPYDGQPTAAAQLAEFPVHGALGIDASVAPAPAMISNGWNDDLFPVSEGVRYYNQVRALHPTTPINMFHVNYGHPNRGGTPPVDDVRAVYTAETVWFNKFVKGDGFEYANAVGGVTIATSKCSGTTVVRGDAFAASNWAALSPGEIRLSATGKQTIAPGTGPAATYEGNGVTVCTDAPATPTAGAATLTSDPVPAGGFTIAGSPTVVADLTVGGANDQVIGRLLDVDPASGNAKLIGRSIYRPTGVGTSRQVFQLHPQAYAIAAGHQVRLELLSADAPYARTATGQGSVDVANVELRIPTLDRPGAAGGAVKEPAAKVLPAGYALARDVAAAPAVAPVVEPTQPTIIPSAVVPPAPVVVTPKDPLTAAAAREALLRRVTGVKLSRTRSTLTFTDALPEAGTVRYRLSIDVRRGKKTTRRLLGTATKTVTAAGKVKVVITISKSRRSLVKSNGRSTVVLATALTTAIEKNVVSTTRKFRAGR